MHCRIYHPLNQVYQTPSFSHTEKMIEMPKSTNHDGELIDLNVKEMYMITPYRFSKIIISLQRMSVF